MPYQTFQARVAGFAVKACRHSTITGGAGPLEAPDQHAAYHTPTRTNACLRQARFPARFSIY